MTPDIWQTSPSVPVLEKPPRPVAKLNGHTPPELTTLKAALDAIPNSGANASSGSLTYDEWRNVIFGIHHATGGSDAGLALAHEFSARSDKYQAEFLDDRVWPYVGRSEGNSVITERTIYSLAAAHGWTDPSIADDFEAIEGEFEEVTPAKTKALKKFEFVPAAIFKAGEPPGWIIKHLLPRQELIVIYGESGAGKSFAVLDMLVHIAEERDWRGLKVTKGLNVGYIAAEGAAGFRLRLDAAAKHFDARLERLAVMAGAPNFMEREDIITLGKSMIAYGRLDVLVVDTLAQVTAGANENAGEDMGRVISHCKTLHAVTGATIVLIHHSGKDASRGARGWSGIKGALDAELEVTRSGDDRCITVSKLKDGKGEGAQYGFKLIDVPLGMDDDGEVYGSCVVEHTQVAAANRSAGPKGVNEKLILRVIEELSGVTEARVKHVDVVDAAVAQMPFDSGSGKRDRRRDVVVRAIESLREGGHLVVSGTELELVK